MAGTRTRQWALPFALLITGLIAGILIGRHWAGKGGMTSIHEVHEKGLYRLTNPLLECEGAASTIGDTELRPFQGAIEGLVKNIERQGRASSVSVYFRDMNDGPWFGVNVDEKYSPASLMKVPIMIVALKQAEADPRFLQKKIAYDGRNDLNWEETFRPPAGMTPGTSYSVDELLFRMIAYSDNNVAGMLGKHLDDKQFRELFSDLGVPVAEPSTDTITVLSYSPFFRVLFNGSYLNRDLSERALLYLTQSEFRQGLAAGLPSDVVIAHKFGESLSNADARIRELHECGIVYYPFSPYLLCVMTKGSDLGTLSGVLRDVSRLVYQEVDEQARTHQHPSP